MKKTGKENDISFLGKIFVIFGSLWAKIKRVRILSTIKENQKKLAGYSDEDSPAESKLSYRFGMTKTMCLTVLCIVLCLAIIFGGSMISYENVYYMFKDISYIHSYSEKRPTSLNYSKAVSNQDIIAFKNGLAVAGDSEIKFFTSTGRVTMTRGSSYTNPKISCSNGTALIYDQGRKAFSVYNSFISVYSEELDYPVSYGDMSDNGCFAILTRSQKYSSVVRVYNSRFDIVMEYSKNDHVIASPMSDDSKHIAVLSVSTEGGESLVGLNVVGCDKGQARSSVTLKGVMPYGCQFLSNDRVAVYCADSVHVYDLDGNLKNIYYYPSSLSYASFKDDGFALMFEGNAINSGSALAVFDANGQLTYSDMVEGNIADMTVSGDYVYILLSNEIIRIDTKFGIRSISEFLGDNARLVALNDGEAMVCTDGTAYYISFN